tara:strand:+ start:220 stop:930 length:711 start_codon:yes stop_codon:yes gene_type:complete
MTAVVSVSNLINSLRFISGAIFFMVYLYSYPHSGRSWVQMILDEFEIDSTVDHGTMINEKYYHNKTFTDSHGTFAYLIRNPFDVLTSRYLKFSRKYGDMWISLEKFLLYKSPTLNKTQIEDIFAHYTSGLRYQKIYNNFVIIKYEALISEDGHKELKKLLPNIPESILKQTLSKYSLDNVTYLSKCDPDFSSKYSLQFKMNGGGSKYKELLSESQINDIENFLVDNKYYDMHLLFS